MRMTGIAKAEAIRLALGLGVLGVTVTGLSTVATGAFFSDTRTAAANNMVAGTVQIGLTPTTQTFNVPAMAPGDVKYGSITVQNSGTLQERYAMTSVVSAGDQGLASQLKLSAVTVSGTCDATSFAASGSTVIPGATLASTTLFGSSTQGQQVGDRVLDAGTQETLCFRVELPLATPDAYQGKGANVAFRFDSEQTANNP